MENTYILKDTERKTVLLKTTNRALALRYMIYKKQTHSVKLYIKKGYC